MGRTVLTVDPAQGERRRAETHMLGPEIPDQPSVAKLVKGFEDGFNEKLRRPREKRRRGEAPAGGEQGHFWAPTCACVSHREGEQWKRRPRTRRPGRRWSTQEGRHAGLHSCHSGRLKQPGGSRPAPTPPSWPTSSARPVTAWARSTTRLRHAPRRITEQTCVTLSPWRERSRVQLLASSCRRSRTATTRARDSGEEEGAGAMMKGHGSSH